MKRPIFLLLMLTSLLLVQSSDQAQETADGIIQSSSGIYPTLSEAVDKAKDGDIIQVYGGVHKGPIVVRKSVTLIGHDWPVIDGEGVGTVLELKAPEIEVRGFVITNSGASLDKENSGISVEAQRILIENNRLEETLFGIYLRETNGSVIRNNLINSKDLDLPRRGDPIRIWFSNDVLIENNTVEKGRDVVLWYSNNLTVRGNEVSEGRYGLHFMYCDNATVENNLLIDNSVGAFLMYSRNLSLDRNTIALNHGPSGYGIGLKDMDDAMITSNLFYGNRIGAHLDNSPREVDSLGYFEGNVFAYNDIGVNLMPSVRNNVFDGNNFIDNEEHVGIGGGGGFAEANKWSVNGSGNYWSDYAGYDLSQDGIGDVPYRSNRLFENLLDNTPNLRLFLYSPAAQAIDFAAQAVPFIKPSPKLVDFDPLMNPSIPGNTPGMPKPNSSSLFLISLILITVPAIVMLLPKFSLNREW